MRVLMLFWSLGALMGLGSAVLAQSAPPASTAQTSPPVAAFPVIADDEATTTQAPATLAPQPASPPATAAPQPAPAPVAAPFPTEVSEGESDSAVPEPVAALGEPAPQGRFLLGLRLGYGVPMGEAFTEENMTDVFAGQIPIGLDIGYMVSPKFMLGLYAQYGFGRLGGDFADDCERLSGQGVSCSLSDVRFGLQAQYHGSPGKKVNPWLGLGVGYEVMTLGRSGRSGEQLSLAAKGFELVHAQAGLDFAASSAVGIGPYVGLSIGQYDTIAFDDGTTSESERVESADRAFHEWVTFGVRAAFRL